MRKNESTCYPSDVTFLQRLLLSLPLLRRCARKLCVYSYNNPRKHEPQNILFFYRFNNHPICWGRSIANRFSPAWSGATLALQRFFTILLWGCLRLDQWWDRTPCSRRTRLPDQTHNHPFSPLGWLALYRACYIAVSSVRYFMNTNPYCFYI